jgi:hypothetical protein
MILRCHAIAAAPNPPALGTRCQPVQPAGLEPSKESIKRPALLDKATSRPKRRPRHLWDFRTNHGPPPAPPPPGAHHAIRRPQSAPYSPPPPPPESTSHVEPPPAGVHLLSVVDPLELSRLAVKSPLLQALQLQREPGPQLLQARLHHLLLLGGAAATAAAAAAGDPLLLLLENVAVVPARRLGVDGWWVGGGLMRWRRSRWQLEWWLGCSHGDEPALPPPPEEHEIALVVERHRPPPSKLRVLVEQRRQHAADAAPQPRVKVVEDQLGAVGGRAAVALGRLGSVGDGLGSVGGRLGWEAWLGLGA